MTDNGLLGGKRWGDFRLGCNADVVSALFSSQIIRTYWYQFLINRGHAFLVTSPQCVVAALAAKLSRIKHRSVRSSGDNGQGPNLNKRVSSTVSHLLYPVQVMRCEMYLRA